MSVLEAALCRSAPWRAIARHAVLPWALQGEALRGDVLELGGGSGAMAVGAARSHPTARLTVTDVDPAMVEAAARALSQLRNVTVDLADMTALPYPDRSFDIATSYLMLHHVVDWRRGVEEVARVLRPGGVFVGYDLTDTPITRAVHVVDRSAHLLVVPSDLHAQLQEAGFADVTVRTGFAGTVARFRARRPMP